MLKSLRNYLNKVAPFFKKAFLVGLIVGSLILLVIAIEILWAILGFPTWQAIELLNDQEGMGFSEVASTVQPLILEGLKAALPGLSGLAISVTAYAAIRNLRLTQDRQATDLFVKAAEMLGSENLEVRLAGIYSLERIAKNFPKDHQTVIQVLIAFIQNRSSLEPLKKVQLPSLSHTLTPERMTIIDRDAQVALTVIGRRTVKNDSGLRLVLDGVDLSFARLDKTANLNNASLCSVSLSSARLEGSKLIGIECTKSGLQYARFNKVDLRNADLSSSGLTGAIFRHTDLRNVVLANADVCITDFRTSSKGLRPEQVKAAKGWEYALYDPDFAIRLAKHPPHNHEFVERLKDVASGDPEFAKQLAEHDPEFAKELGLSVVS